MNPAIGRVVPFAVKRAPRVFSRTLPSHPQCCYFAYRPAGEIDPDRLFVSVHGISRNALEHALLFRRWADRLGIAVIAPLFSRAHFRRYQTLGAWGDSPPADVAFDLILEDARALFGIEQARTYLFGYSGGGQFAHRYALRHPQQVARMVVGAAGWYTFPDPVAPYPYGLAADGAVPAFADLSALAQMPPTRVVVGSADRIRDDALNTKRRIDHQQGRNRRVRAKRWVEAMDAAAAALSVPSRCSFQLLPGASHAFAPAVELYGLDRAVVGFLFDFPDDFPPRGCS